jgi:probable HAF family extracellular repeat protein
MARVMANVMVATIVLAAGSAMGAAPSYVAASIGTLPGGTGSICNGVNDIGDACGQADDNEGFNRAVVWSGGELAALPMLPGGSYAEANCINNSMQIVGEAKNADDVSRPVMWSKDHDGNWIVQDLGTLHRDNVGFGVATRINENGDVVGYATAVTSYHPFLLADGVKTDLGTLHFSGNFAYGQALGLNDVGGVVGFAYAIFQGPEHGFRFDAEQVDITPDDAFGLAQGFNITNGGVIAGYISGLNVTQSAFNAATFTDRGGWSLIPLLSGDTDSYAFDINANEDVVGASTLPAYPFALSRGFLWSGGVLYDLNQVTQNNGYNIAEAKDISNTGMIAATVEGPAGPLGVVLLPGEACRADYNGDGFLDFTDFDDFVGDFDAGLTRADFNDDGFLDFTDFDAFVNSFEAGCGLS